MATRTIEFEYKKILPDLPSQQPIASAIVYIRNKACPIIGIIDSGADNVTIPFNMVIDSGLNRDSLKKADTGCACGNSKFITYLCEAQIEIGGYKFPITLCLTDSNSTPLIGRQCVFDFLILNSLVKRKNIL